MENNIICLEKNMCTGCTACVNICPQKCIKMKPNKEGFFYPEIDTMKCVDCGLCERTCPVNTPVKKYGIIGAYIVRYNSYDIVAQSTSGGTSAALAEYVFSKNGVFCGVGYSEDFVPMHLMVTSNNKELMKDIRGSKYVQSSLKDVFQNIKKHLDDNVLVCFTGTACQVAGLKSFLGKEYENLITVDLVCHGVASPYVFKSYVDFQTSKYKSQPNRIVFRNKTYGYHSGTMMIEFQNGKRYYGSGRIDPMLKAYFSGACSRLCCYECHFKGMERCSDFTVFDSWHAGEISQDIVDDDRGYTNMFVHTEKAAKILTEIADIMTIYSANAQTMKDLDGIMIDENPDKPEYRSNFIMTIKDKGLDEAIRVYLPITKVDYAIEKSKYTAYKTGFMKLIRKLRS